MQKVCLISMNNWILMYAWEMVIEIWGFSLERLVATWDFLYKSDLQKYSAGIFIIDTSCWGTYCISWHMAKGFYGTWLRSCICVVVDVLRDWLVERGWWLRSCEGKYTCSWFHTPIWNMTRVRHICLEWMLCMRMHAQGIVTVWRLQIYVKEVIDG